MSFLEWNQGLKIGVPEMDAEHEVLVRCMNNLHGLVERSAPKPTLENALETLLSYTVKHFRDEEAYLASIRYAKYDIHCSIHRQLVTKLQRYRDDFAADRIELGTAFFGFLKLWLSAHILQIDRQYVGCEAA